MMILKVQNYKKCGISPRSLSPRISRISRIYSTFSILHSAFIIKKGNPSRSLMIVNCELSNRMVSAAFLAAGEFD